MSGDRRLGYSDASLALHSDRFRHAEHGAIHAPLHVSTAYRHADSRALVAVFQGKQPGSVYARQGNPTGSALEAKLTLLERARGCIGFTSGMAALAATLLSLLKAGDHIVCNRFLFGNTVSLLRTLDRFGVQVSFVDATDAAAVEAALTPATRMVLTETIANPRTQVADLRRIGRLCVDRGVLYVVDSTITTPLLCRPKDFQAGLVIHSLSKGISGHGNAMGGAVIDTGVFDWSRYANVLDVYRSGPPEGWGLLQIRKLGLRDFGATLRSEDAHRIAVGVETLALRMGAACANALALATWLTQRPEIHRVHYPGLPAHPQHALAAELFGGRFGSLLSMELRKEVDPFRFLDSLHLVIVSSHLADNRSMAIPVASTIFNEVGPEGRALMGITDGLIRLSVGIEPLEDLEADIDQALVRAIG